MDFEYAVLNNVYKGTVEFRDNRYVVSLNNKTREIEWQRISESAFLFILDNRIYQAFIADGNDGNLYVSINGESYVIKKPEQKGKKRLASAKDAKGDKVIRSKVPGKIVKITVSEGDSVDEGKTLVVVEAMKMENQVQAPYKGKIKNVFVRVGKQINFGEPLLEFE